MLTATLLHCQCRLRAETWHAARSAVAASRVCLLQLWDSVGDGGMAAWLGAVARDACLIIRIGRTLGVVHQSASRSSSSDH